MEREKRMCDKPNVCFVPQAIGNCSYDWMRSQDTYMISFCELLPYDLFTDQLINFNKNSEIVKFRKLSIGLGRLCWVKRCKHIKNFIDTVAFCSLPLFRLVLSYTKTIQTNSNFIFYILSFCLFRTHTISLIQGYPCRLLHIRSSQNESCHISPISIAIIWIFLESPANFFAEKRTRIY